MIMAFILHQHPYEDLLCDVYMNGEAKEDRTGTGTRSVFGRQIRYDLGDGFPLITTKKVHFKSIVLELLWFLRGDTNVKWLQEKGCMIWNEWARENGDLGPVYGKQWRDWTDPRGGSVDQIENLVYSLRHKPDSRRMVVSAWNVADLPSMMIEPCHFAFQCFVSNNRLSLQVHQRSCDMFLGVPFNIASYALLIHMLAQQCNLSPGDLVWTGGDCHIYNNHMDQVREQLSRTPRTLPTLIIKRDVPSIFEYEEEDFVLRGYDPHPAIKAQVSI